MNSSQLNFFSSPSEWDAIVNFLHAKGMKWINDGVDDPNNVEFKDVRLRNEQQPSQMLLVNEKYLDDVFFQYKERTKLYDVDISKSLVVQFSPGGLYPRRPNILDRGRFYCATSYYVSNGESVAKDEAFRKWLRSFYNSFKKEFLVKEKGTYMIYYSKEIFKKLKDNTAVVNPACSEIEFKN